jgi:hypothetical protein
LSAAGADLLIRTFEEAKARALGQRARRDAGVYYTPPAIADQVVELALRHGGVRGTVLDPCAGAGAFLVAAARAGLTQLRGFDLDAAALGVARRALRLCGVRPALRQADALRAATRPVDLVVSNPPYGHVGNVRERAALIRMFPALKGGEIDRYAAFLLRALQLVRPGGAAALLVPDTWMIAAVVDLGKPFAAAKDTRVQAVVLVRRTGVMPASGVGPRASSLRAKASGLGPRASGVGPRVSGLRKKIYFFSTFVARGREELAPVAREELVATAQRGWFVYRTPAERELCAAMESASVPLGSVCEVGYGLRTGNNPRHVLRRPPGADEVGLVGGEDIVPFALRWKQKTLANEGPLLALVERQRGRPRIAIQRIRTNAQAPWARWLEAAPVPAELVCLDSLSTLACASDDLLWGLLGLVSSVAMNRFHRLRTTDVNVKPSALRELPVPRALLGAPGRLARLARERAEVGVPSHPLDRRIDAEVYALFGLSLPLVEACERGFWADRLPEEFQLLEQAMSDPPGSLARASEGTA